MKSVEEKLSRKPTKNTEALFCAKDIVRIVYGAHSIHLLVQSMIHKGFMTVLIMTIAFEFR